MFRAFVLTQPREFAKLRVRSGKYGCAPKLTALDKDV